MSEPIKVTILPTTIWIENGFGGERVVVAKHEGMEPFDYAIFNYRYGYTDNASTHRAAVECAKSIGATEPVEMRSRPLPALASLPSNPEHDTYGAPPVGALTEDDWGAPRATPRRRMTVAELTLAQISECARDAQIAFYLDKYPSFEVALARKIEAALAAPSHPPATVMDCEDCNGTGEVGDEIYQGEFQPPERERCTSCDGSGRWKVEPAVAVQAEPDYRQLLSDLRYAVNARPSCQKGAMDRCRCMSCSMLRSYDALVAHPKPAPVEAVAVQAEPVAWAATSEDGKVEALGMNQSRRFDTPLYFAHPKPAAPATADDAVSDSEIHDIADDFKSQYVHGGTTFDEFDYYGFARRILALRSGASAQHAEGGVKP